MELWLILWMFLKTILVIKEGIEESVSFSISYRSENTLLFFLEMGKPQRAVCLKTVPVYRFFAKMSSFSTQKAGFTRKTYFFR